MDVYWYRLDDKGEVEGRIFKANEDVPKGWVDTPAKLKKPTPKRKPKVAD